MYLILHKVRGKPAFDVATQITIGNDLGWIISTSGHRAYPAWSMPIEDIIDLNVGDFAPDLADVPDHYDVGAAPKPDFNIMAFVAKLMPKIKRRI